MRGRRYGRLIIVGTHLSHLRSISPGAPRLANSLLTRTPKMFTHYNMMGANDDSGSSGASCFGAGEKRTAWSWARSRSATAATSRTWGGRPRASPARPRTSASTARRRTWAAATSARGSTSRYAPRLLPALPPPEAATLTCCPTSSRRFDEFVREKGVALCWGGAGRRGHGRMSWAVLKLLVAFVCLKTPLGMFSCL